MSDSTNQSHDKREYGFRLGELSRYRVTKKGLADLASELRRHGLVTADGLPVRFAVTKYGTLEVSIRCTKEEFDMLAAQRDAREKAEALRADALAVLRVQRREVLSKDYSDEAMKRSLGISGDDEGRS